MRLTSLLPFIALLGLTACDSAKVAELTGAKPAATAACTPSPVPTCAPAPGVAPTAMAPEGDKGAQVGTQVETTTQAAPPSEDQASVKVQDDHFAAPPTPAAYPTASRAYSAAAHRYHYTRHAVRRVHAATTRKVIVIRKNYYIHDTRYVPVDRPVYQPPQVVYPQAPRPPVYVQPQRPAVYVDREIDRTSSAYGRQVYNRYAHSAGPPVVYHGVYRQDQRVYSGVRQDQYVYDQRSSGSGYRYGSGSGYQQGYRGGATYDCNCASMPAAGRDRSGYLTWPGKTESRTY